jgi:hypothetical protein
LLGDIIDQTSLLCANWAEASIVQSTGARGRKRKAVPQPAVALKKLETIRICLVAFQFHQDFPCLRKGHEHPNMDQFWVDQKFAYASVKQQSLVVMPSLTVNVSWIAHVLNYFSWYTHGNPSMGGNYWDHFNALFQNEKPRLWTEPLGRVEPAKLGRMWKGTYSYLERDQISALREPYSKPGTYKFPDRNIDNDHPIQTMKMWAPAHQPDTPKGHSYIRYVDDFEPHLNTFTKLRQPQHGGRTDPNTSAALASTYGYEGIGYDDEDFYATGWITPLPPQFGIPGFQRMTMMKYFRHGDSVDWGALWAYEGVILPGGQVIVGRWWEPEGLGEEHQYSGPFILWCVDDAYSEEEKNVSLLSTWRCCTILVFDPGGSYTLYYMSIVGFPF